MVKRFIAISLLVVSLVLAVAGQQPGPGGESSYFPISLNKSNPHYFAFRGNPTVLITSAEHYGAVLNPDFNYITYLDVMQNCGFNLTRIFLGDYVSAPGFFDYPVEDPLTPAPGRLLAPWARSSVPGYANGGNKFDLSKWDETYFKRLKDFITQAGIRGIVVEITFFCPYYDNGLSPYCSDNNIQGLTSTTNALGNTALVAVQEALVKKVVSELKDFDNIYYEACNEPYHGGGPRDWQDHIIQKIVEAERSFTHKHLIAECVANYTSAVTDPNPNISIFNWHYAYLDNQTLDGDIATRNYGLNKPLGDDETGTTSDNNLYRKEGWETIIAGCAIYNNLDMSFLYTDETGSVAPVPIPGNRTDPNGGGPVLREWLKILKDFIYGFDFVAMKPDNSVIVSGVPDGARVRALVEEERQYAIYIRGGSGIANLEVKLPKGRYKAKWLNTKTGENEKTEKFRHKGGNLILTSPSYSEDILLSIKTSGVQ